MAKWQMWTADLIASAAERNCQYEESCFCPVEIAVDLIGAPSIYCFATEELNMMLNLTEAVAREQLIVGSFLCLEVPTVFV